MKTTIILGTLLALLTTGALADCPGDTRGGVVNCGVRSGEAVIGTIAITGRVQGPFPGGPFTVLGFTHDIVSPRDPASGLPTGKRQHKPLVVRIPVSAVAPLVMNAIAMNESLSTVTLNLYDSSDFRVGRPGRI
jgi:type VI secretion system Hcp family effector